MLRSSTSWRMPAPNSSPPSRSRHAHAHVHTPAHHVLILRTRRRGTRPAWHWSSLTERCTHSSRCVPRHASSRYIYTYPHCPPLPPFRCWTHVSLVHGLQGRGSPSRTCESLNMIHHLRVRLLAAHPLLQLVSQLYHWRPGHLRATHLPGWLPR